jgi:hypothetical protein
MKNKIDKIAKQSANITNLESLGYGVSYSVLVEVPLCRYTAL